MDITKTRWVMVPAYGEGITGDVPIEMSEQCAVCKHIIEALRCRAFPEGVPEDILNGKFDHTQPHRGDHGLRYKRM